jgi:catechol 2,3-dioxygenase-like lactoylglutathione lyase family enzyme
LAKVQAVRCVDVAVTDLERADRFYRDVWGLSGVASAPGARFYRGTGRYHQIFALFERPKAALLRIVFDAADRDQIDGLYAAVVSFGLKAVEKPHQLSRPGGGYGFGFKDPEGRSLAVVCGVDDHGAAIADGGERPGKISHVVLNSGDVPAAADFYRRALGFRVVDESRAMKFLCCNADHHSIALAHAQASTLNHISFEMTDIDAVMRGASRVRDHGYPIEWGPGRHGAGSNIFCYFAGPEELPIEYTAEVEQIDDDYIPHGPEYWDWPPNRTDRWGITAPPSARMKRVQQAYRFNDEYGV